MRFRLRYSEVDSGGRLTIVSLINYLQDTVTFVSDEAGCTLQYLMENGWGWFITSWEIYIDRLPSYGEEIEIDTWATELKGVIAYRDIIINGCDGNLIVKARSLWVLMDLKKLSPIRIPADLLARYDTREPLPGEWRGRRIKTLDGLLSDEPERLVEVLHLHLDTNGHMNNAYYVEIAREQIPEGKRISSIRTEYKKSAVLGDVINVFEMCDGDLLQVALTSGNKDIFALVEFEIL